MWAIRRRVDPSAFGDIRVVVHFEFTDQPQAKRWWWLVNDGGDVDLCPKDPGFEVDLYVVTDLKTMAEIWVGKLPLSAAADTGRFDLTGQRTVRQAFKNWLLLGPFARDTVSTPEPAVRGRKRAIGVHRRNTARSNGL
jgi:hypothetical protein